MQNSDRTENRIAGALFSLALVFHAWGAHVGWNSLNLPGCEFRQTQTAISALFIQRENNFSLAYPTPVLGKPWSIPMEFPLYQWTVVGLSNGSGLPLTQAGRAVSLACFYLTIPALYLLLARLGLPPARRLVLLALVLCCPLYIFYARAFLIETMAWMFAAWFLLGYVETVERRNWVWWVVAGLAGAGAGLVKVTTLLLFLLPAAAWALVWLWRDFRRTAGGDRWKILLTRARWSGSVVLLPCVASIWWLRYADGVKAQSVAGAFLQSSPMKAYNFGTEVRWSGEIWRQHWTILFQELTSVPVLLGCTLLALFFARRWWALMLALLFFFLVVQVIFPILYAWHEYYYVANAVMLMFAFGLALCGVLESRLPRLVAWGAIVCVLAGQGWGYISHHYPEQKKYSVGTNTLARAFAAVTEPDEVVVMAGDDWSSITPYFAKRRALMIRRNLERTWEIIRPAFAALAGEPVMALTLRGKEQQNQTLLGLAHQYFQIDPRPVAFCDENDTALYVHEQMRNEGSIIKALKTVSGMRLAPGLENEPPSIARREIEMAELLPRYRGNFSRMHPLPWKFLSTFGAEPFDLDGTRYLMADPESKFWFKTPVAAHTMTIELLMLPEAYAESVKWGDRSDGVEVAVKARTASGVVQNLFSGYINPRDNPANRGIQRLQFEFQLSAEAEIELAILPGPAGNGARDWTLVRDVRID